MTVTTERVHLLVPMCGTCGQPDRTVMSTSLPGGKHGGNMCASCYAKDPAVRKQRRDDLVTLAERLYTGADEYPTVHELLGRWRIPKVDRVRLWVPVEKAVELAREATDGNISPSVYNLPDRDALDQYADDAIDEAVTNLLDAAQLKAVQG